MDFDLFFSSPRWRILEIIAKKPSSPLEISSRLKTSVAYVSQQLKLLEAADLVHKEKTGQAEKGKPRNIYSISREILHLTSLMHNLPLKKVVYLTDYHKLILRIWLLDNVDLHYYLEKFYWQIEEDLNDITGIFVDLSSNKGKVIVVSDNKKLKLKIDNFEKNSKNKLQISLLSESEFKNISQKDLYPIHDPSLIMDKKNLKGGDSINED